MAGRSAEKLSVTPIEASVNLLNEIFCRQPDDPKIAKILHGSSWKNHHFDTGEPVRLTDFSDDIQKSSLLIVAVEQALNKINSREQRCVRLRFGFEDQTMHTLGEIGSEFGFKGSEQARQIIGKALRRFLYPSRSNRLSQFLPENQQSEAAWSDIDW